MQATTKFFAIGAFAAIAALGAVGASAGDRMDGADYHPHQTTAPATANAEVDAGAIAAAHPSGTEPIGQSTSAPMVQSAISSDEVYAGAVAAAHPSGTEPVGQSTSAPMVQSAFH